ncbi:MaoC family dehydratase [Thermodesulfobacteriota bacterium]
MGKQWKAIEDVLVGDDLGTYQYRISIEKVKDFVECLDNLDPLYLEDSPLGGPLVPPFYFCDDFMPLWIQARYPVKLLNVGNEYEFKHPVKPGTLLTVRGKITNKYIKRERTYLDAEIMTTDEHGNVVCSAKIFQCTIEKFSSQKKTKSTT